VYPATYDLRLYRGDFFELTFVLREATWDGTQWVPGLPMNLTEWSGNAQIRSTYDAAGVLSTFEVEIVDEAGGVVRLSMPGDQTAMIAETAAVWDVQLTDTSIPPRVHTYLRGKVTIDKDVTR